jgi:hypothetical protein
MIKSKKSLKRSNKSEKKPIKSKFVKLTLDLLRTKYLNGEKKIKYYYGDGGDPNIMSQEYLDKYILPHTYYFIPNGNLVINEISWNRNDRKIKKTKIENFLGSQFDKKIINYESKSSNIFYTLEGKHILDESKPFDSQIIICSRPAFALSDNCIGGPNWIKE